MTSRKSRSFSNLCIILIVQGWAVIIVLAWFLRTQNVKMVRTTQSKNFVDESRGAFIDTKKIIEEDKYSKTEGSKVSEQEVKVNSTRTYKVDDAFSGFYKVTRINAVGKRTSEEYAAAWLISKSLFIQTLPQFEKAINLEGVTFALTRFKYSRSHRFGQIQNPRLVVTTRDYFDFMVEHLSIISNQSPEDFKSNPMISPKAMYNEYLLSILREKSEELRLLQNTPVTESRLNETIAVIVFSSNSFSIFGNSFQAQIRVYYLMNTFWSLHRYFKSIICYVAGENDYQMVLETGLPFYQVRKIDLNNTFVNGRGNRTVILPSLSLRDLGALWQSTEDDTLAGFKYVYYTEGDQVLHMRSLHHFYDLIDSSGGYFTVVPHRMQVLPVKMFLPSSLKRVINPKSSFNLETAVMTEPMNELKGSCCDDGIYVIAPCGNWWYRCTEWGIQNISPFLRIGVSGIPFPSTSVHMFACKHSAERQVCSLPPDCRFRELDLLPQSEVDAMSSEDSKYPMSRYLLKLQMKVCPISPKVQYIGPVSH